MMKLKYLIIFFVIQFVTIPILNEVTAQVGCGTTSPKEDYISLLKKKEKLPPLINKQSLLYPTFNVKFHIIRNKKGKGNNIVTPIECKQAFDELIVAYNQIDICFFYQGYNYIDDNNLYAFQLGDTASLFSTNKSENAIDVYIIPVESTVLGVSGLARQIKSTQLLVTYDVLLNGSTLIHEAGHCLGLYHTHETVNGVELISGANCSTAGDLICDTPADPELNNNSVSVNCFYTGDPTYNPDVRNFMSYSRKICRTQFTVGQKARILNDVLPYYLPLQSAIVNSDLIVSNITFPTSSFPVFLDFRIYAGNSIITQGQVTVPLNSDVSFVSSNYVLLEDGFTVGLGAKFRAYVANSCPIILVKNSLTFENNDEIGFVSEKSEMKNNKVYPNPSTGIFNAVVSGSFENGKYQIYDFLGRTVAKGQIITKRFSIDLSGKENGIYTIVFSNGTNIDTQKIIKQ